MDKSLKMEPTLNMEPENRWIWILEPSYTLNIDPLKMNLYVTKFRISIFNVENGTWFYFQWWSIFNATPCLSDSKAEHHIYETTFNIRSFQTKVSLWLVRCRGNRAYEYRWPYELCCKSDSLYVRDQTKINNCFFSFLV